MAYSRYDIQLALMVLITFLLVSFCMGISPLKNACYQIQGKKATAFPPMCSKLSDQSEVENRVLVDGNLITSRGPGTAMEFALAIVEKFYSREKAIELGKSMVFTYP